MVSDSEGSATSGFSGRMGVAPSEFWIVFVEKVLRETSREPTRNFSNAALWRLAVSGDGMLSSSSFLSGANPKLVLVAPALVAPALAAAALNCMSALPFIARFASRFEMPRR